jgi:glycosyltransferase involved in cell wall biosynthesis
MVTPFFSVIIPVLNEEKYLPHLLTNLSEQTYRDFEVLVVDAHSTDKTKEKFSIFQKDLPPAQFLQSEKRHVSSQRNLGAKHAKGEYLVFFDADVDFEPTYLEELHIACLKKKIEFATCWMEADSKNPLDQLMVTIANLGWELGKSINMPFIGGWNIIIKPQAFSKLQGFREDTKISEDHDLAIRAAKKNIDLTILHEPQVVFSLRRFRSEGTLSVLRKYATAQIHMLLKGPITSELYEYKMGGHVHTKRKKKINFGKLNTYIQKMEEVQQDITKLFLE